MGNYLKLAKSFVILSASLIASNILATSPTKAATFAMSEASLEFADFSHKPLDTFTDTNSDSLSIFKGGNVAATGDAIAFLKVNPPEGFNFAYSLARGDSKDYIGLTDSTTTLRGIFEIDENSLLSFNFAANLALETSVDDNPAENATAKSEMFFALLDVKQNRLLDFFLLNGNLTTKNSSDFIAYDTVGNVSSSDSSADFNYGGKREYAKASVKGTVQRSFTKKTTVTLISGMRNQARVSAPEPATCIALIFYGGVMGVVLKRRR